MSKVQDGRKAAPEFGKRGGKSVVVPAETGLSALQRLVKAGGRWLGKMQPKGKRQPRPLGFRKARPAT